MRKKLLELQCVDESAQTREKDGNTRIYNKLGLKKCSRI